MGFVNLFFFATLGKFLTNFQNNGVIGKTGWKKKVMASNKPIFDILDNVLTYLKNYPAKSENKSSTGRKTWYANLHCASDYALNFEKIWP